MSGDALAVGRKTERTYFRRLARVLGAKGAVVLIAFPAVVLLTAEDIHPVFAGGILAGAFGYALVVDSDSGSEEIYEGSNVKIKTDEPLMEKIDGVGLSFVVLTLGYVLVSYWEIGVDWRMTAVAAGVIFGAVVYDYGFGSDGEGEEVDIVGFAVAEVLVVYSIVIGTGWEAFGNSATFGVLAFLVYAGTVAGFAGYAVVTREVIVSRTDDEIHEALIGATAEVYYLDEVEGDARYGLASYLRRASESLDGVRVPTLVNDGEGRVPIVVSTRSPDGRLFATDTDEILETAKEERLTGYAVYGNNVLFFRNGTLSKYYHDGEFGFDADELEDSVTEATLHALDHSTLVDLDDVTPKPETVKSKEESDEEEETLEIAAEPGTDGSDEDDEGGEGGQKLDIGGDEIDMEEMFEKADEVMDEIDDL